MDSVVEDSLRNAETADAAISGIVTGAVVAEETLTAVAADAAAVEEAEVVTVVVAATTTIISEIASEGRTQGRC